MNEKVIEEIANQLGIADNSTVCRVASAELRNLDSSGIDSCYHCSGGRKDRIQEV